jgi:4-amino-4-deoxy-L-arabinose transferase-like glycosyltransferase
VLDRTISAYRPYLILFAGSLVFRLLLGFFFSQPGYTDAYYYSNVAEALWQGRGFREDYIWNYLGRPLPADLLNNPSSTYWMPLTSILIYLAYLLTGGPSFLASQIPNILLSSLLPLLAFYIATDIFGANTERGRRYGWLAGLLTIFCGPYAPRFATPDNFAPYALFSCGFLVCTYKALRLSPKQARAAWGWMVLAGFCAGLAYLTRVDGVILLAAAGLAWLIFRYLLRQPTGLNLTGLGLMTLVFVLTIAPWLTHNLLATGQLFPGGGIKVLFWREYNDFFSYSKNLDLSYYLNQTDPSPNWGLGPLLLSKLDASVQNIQVVVLGALFMLPLFLIGLFTRLPQPEISLITHSSQESSFPQTPSSFISHPSSLLWRRAEFLPFVIYTLLLYLAMTLAFTFPSTRGSVFHSSGGLLPFIYLICLVGLDRAISWLSKISRPKAERRRQRNYGTLVVVAYFLISLGFGFIVRNGWDSDYNELKTVGQWMQANAPAGARIMVPDPPAYWYVNHKPALAITSDPLSVNLELARRYGVRYFLYQPNHAGVAYLEELYKNKGAPNYTLVATLGDLQIYELEIRGL